jgi:hypothetical protein
MVPYHIYRVGVLAAAGSECWLISWCLRLCRMSGLQRELLSLCALILIDLVYFYLLESAGFCICELAISQQRQFPTRKLAMVKKILIAKVRDFTFSNSPFPNSAIYLL